MKKKKMMATVILEEQSATVWTGLNRVGIGSTDGLLWKSDELTGSVKEVNFFAS
jgi:hypothetical protein